MNFFEKLLSNVNPTSAMRYVFVVCVLFIVFMIIGVWAIISIGTNKIEDIPWGLATFAIGLISIFVAGKVSQSIWGEKPKDASVIKDTVQQ